MKKLFFLSFILLLMMNNVTNGQQDKSKEKQVKFVISTEFGDIKGYLYNETPKHRDNFVKLAKSGFYDGTLFHRVILGFMIQGGDPNSKKAKAGEPLGAGDLGYTVPAEFNSKLTHVRGALAAARTENPTKASSASQFYIVEPEKGAHFLDNNYTVYGQVIEGFDVVTKIASVPKDQRDRPQKDIKMTVKIVD